MHIVKLPRSQEFQQTEELYFSICSKVGLFPTLDGRDNKRNVGIISQRIKQTNKIKQANKQTNKQTNKQSNKIGRYPHRYVGRRAVSEFCSCTLPLAIPRLLKAEDKGKQD